MADLSETTVLSPGEEERLALGPGTPLRSICLCSSKKTHVCVDPCIYLFFFPLALFRGKPRVQPSSSFIILLATQHLAQFAQSTGSVVHFCFYFVSTQFPHFNPVLVQAQSPHWEVAAMLSEVATVLCEVDLRAMEEARHSYSNIFVQKKINMLSVFVSLPLLFD